MNSIRLKSKNDRSLYYVKQLCIEQKIYFIESNHGLTVTDIPAKVAAVKFYCRQNPNITVEAL